MAADELHSMEITSQLILLISKQEEAVICQLVKLYSCTQLALGGNGGRGGRERGWKKDEVRIKAKEGVRECRCIFSPRVLHP